MKMIFLLTLILTSAFTFAEYRDLPGEKLEIVNDALNLKSVNQKKVSLTIGVNYLIGKK